MALMHLDTSMMTDLMKKLDRLGGSVEETLTKEMEKAGQQIGSDTEDALALSVLPAQGRFSTGQTSQSVIRDPKVHNEGTSVWVPIGFNFAEPGAGGFLIGGTPKMEPDIKLNKMYKGKKYMNDVQKEMADHVWDELVRIYSES